MSLNSSFDFLLLDTDVPLCDGGGGVLQELLYEGNVVVAVLVDFRSVEFAEAVGADTVDTQIVTDQLQLLLDGAGGHREDKSVWWNVVVKAVAADELIQSKGDSKRSGLSGLLLRDRQAVAFSIFYDVLKTQLYDVRDTESQVGFQHKGGRNTVIRTASGKALSHGADDFSVLVSGQSNGFSVHKNDSFQRQNTNLKQMKYELWA